MLVRSAFAAALMLSVSHATIAWAASPAGTAVAVRPDASATGTGGDRGLAVDAPVFMGDAINTDTRGMAQIRFADETKLAVGPNSRITIDRFVFAGNQTAKQVTLDVTQGAFRFITGLSNKNAYKVETPTATIGVRGTEWEGAMVDGVLRVTLFGGGLTVCTKTEPRRCIPLSQSCDMVEVSPEGDLKRVSNVYERTDYLNKDFAFAFRQNRLLPDFKVNSGSCNIPNLEPLPNPSGHDSFAVPEPCVDSCGES
jgi:ferric-dicitrate binding protein FerR (iron transport regulator)